MMAHMIADMEKGQSVIDKLIKAQQGDVEHGLVFAGSSAARIHDIPTVHDLMARLVEEWRVAEERGGATT